MRYEAYPVSDHLKHWISGFFHWTGSPPERILPNGQFDLVFSINDEPLDPNEVRVDSAVRTLLYGELRQPLAGLGSGDVDAFGVSLYPWAAEIICGVGARELSGRIVPLQRVGVVDSEPIRAMLSGCEGNIERIRLMEEMFSRIFPTAGDEEKALYRHWVEVWSRGGRETPVEEATLATADQSRFEKLFHRRVGMTVRQFSRLARFHAFLRRLEGGEKIAALAEDIGYYDQAHLTRECRDFAGIPPRQLHVQLASGAGVFRRLASLPGE